MTEIMLSEARLITFVLEDSAGAVVTGLGTTFTVTISQNGGAFQAGVGTKAEIGSGWYSYSLTVDETDTAGPLAVVITGAGAVQQNLLYQVSGYVVTTLTGTGYATLAQLKAALGVTDSADDTALGRVIDAVSREIDNLKHRRFYTTVADEIRYFTAQSGLMLFPGDVLSITTLETDEAGNRTYSRSWATTDYDMLPDNAALDGRPYTRLQVVPNGRYAFPLYRKGVKITGKFGYSSTVPAVVREACLIQSERIWKRKDAPFGIMGTPETGYVRLKAELDPDVILMLSGIPTAVIL